MPYNDAEPDYNIISKMMASSLETSSYSSEINRINKNTLQEHNSALKQLEAIHKELIDGYVLEEIYIKYLVSMEQAKQLYSEVDALIQKQCSDNNWVCSPAEIDIWKHRLLESMGVKQESKEIRSSILARDSRIMVYNQSVIYNRTAIFNAMQKFVKGVDNEIKILENQKPAEGTRSYKKLQILKTSKDRMQGKFKELNETNFNTITLKSLSSTMDGVNYEIANLNTSLSNGDVGYPSIAARIAYGLKYAVVSLWLEQKITPIETSKSQFQHSIGSNAAKKQAESIKELDEKNESENNGSYRVSTQKARNSVLIIVNRFIIRVDNEIKILEKQKPAEGTRCHSKLETLKSSREVMFKKGNNIKDMKVDDLTFGSISSTMVDLNIDIDKLNNDLSNIGYPSIAARIVHGFKYAVVTLWLSQETTPIETSKSQLQKSIGSNAAREKVEELQALKALDEHNAPAAQENIRENRKSSYAQAKNDTKDSIISAYDKFIEGVDKEIKIFEKRNDKPGTRFHKKLQILQLAHAQMTKQKESFVNVPNDSLTTTQLSSTMKKMNEDIDKFKKELYLHVYHTPIKRFSHGLKDMLITGAEKLFATEVGHIPFETSQSHFEKSIGYNSLETIDALDAKSEEYKDLDLLVREMKTSTHPTSSIQQGNISSPDGSHLMTEQESTGWIPEQPSDQASRDDSLLRRNVANEGDVGHMEHVGTGRVVLEEISPTLGNGSAVLTTD
ncbi:MAG: hypothetical protein HOI53_07945 [Francisellaceae bacterium]|mgnify:CR=1 FL=1|jgi:hypothetical protein|nr:hypothetical protein [Francisellaceae bacterium]MBT6207946.1 hypothetical protein [Francisellaceae bacterium]MBT6539865.1 hypothetical protein [Francisellaceae bacterium]